MRELKIDEVESVAGGSHGGGHTVELVTGGSAVATALSRGNPLLSSLTAGLTAGTAINNAFGDQIGDAIWAMSRKSGNPDSAVKTINNSNAFR